jgi:hypothetical protein
VISHEGFTPRTTLAGAAGPTPPSAYGASPNGFHGPAVTSGEPNFAADCQSLKERPAIEALAGEANVLLCPHRAFVLLVVPVPFPPAFAATG